MSSVEVKLVSFSRSDKPKKLIKLLVFVGGSAQGLIARLESKFKCKVGSLLDVHGNTVDIDTNSLLNEYIVEPLVEKTKGGVCGEKN